MASATAINLPIAQPTPHVSIIPSSLRKDGDADSTADNSSLSVSAVEGQDGMIGDSSPDKSAEEWAGIIRQAYFAFGVGETLNQILLEAPRRRHAGM